MAAEGARTAVEYRLSTLAPAARSQPAGSRRAETSAQDAAASSATPRSECRPLRGWAAVRDEHCLRVRLLCLSHELKLLPSCFLKYSILHTDLSLESGD